MVEAREDRLVWKTGLMFVIRGVQSEKQGGGGWALWAVEKGNNHEWIHGNNPFPVHWHFIYYIHDMPE